MKINILSVLFFLMYPFLYACNSKKDIKANFNNPKIIQSDSIRKNNEELEVIKFIETFYKFIANDSYHDRFLFPEMKNNGQYYFLDLDTYLFNLRNSKWFTDDYILSDSILLSNCINDFNSKKYEDDLEGSFFDECQSCNIDFNRITGTDEEILRFNYKTFMKSNDKYVILGNCQTVNNSLGFNLKIKCIRNVSRKLEIESIVVVRPK